MNEEWKDIKQMKKYKIKIKNPILGVPITFLDRYNPEQFEIIWQASGNTRACCPSDILNNELHYVQHKEDRGGCAVIDGKRQYSRILIRKKAGA